MDKIDYLKKIHGELLEIMDVIAAICDNNNLSYYLTGGSLLGAIRHKGFIPWDDDLDIVMPRDDYERFIELCSTQLPEEYYLDWRTTNNEYYNGFAKICRKDTKFVVSNIELGIAVDIFPLDETYGYGKIVEYRRFILRVISVMLRIKMRKIHLKGIEKLIPFLTIPWVFPKSFLISVDTFLRKKDNGKHTKYYTNFASQYPVKRWTMEKKYFESGVQVAFENKYYMAPGNYAIVLESIFGKNYMTLPPVEKRRSHYPSYVKFSDGVEMDFDVPESVVSIKDTIS